jgi:DnaJ-class molecular chaperone
MAKDFYKTLGVAEAATHDEIKKAYRRLAKKYHPDATGGDKSKEARFKEITEAYEVLGDEKKRTAYDDAKKNPFAGAYGAPPGGGNPFAGSAGIDVEELLRRMKAGQGAGGGGGRVRVDTGGGGFGGFGDIFGDMFGGGGATTARAPRKGEDVVARLDIDLPEAALGAEKHITVDGKSLKVKIPAGITDGKTIRLAGQGHPGGRGAPAGDLLIELHERPHPQFRRHAPGSADIDTDMSVPVDVAILGGKAEVRTLEGTTLSLTIPPGTSSGKKLRIKGKGAHVAGASTRGDLYANVSVQVPDKLPEKAKQLLEEFAKTLRQKP